MTLSKIAARLRHVAAQMEAVAAKSDLNLPDHWVAEFLAKAFEDDRAVTALLEDPFRDEGG